MAWRLDKSVVRGEVDNRTPGVVTGRIWLFGRDEPVELRLQGNCWRDLAGTRFLFRNPHPGPGDLTDLQPLQEGKAGDITASRKVRDVPPEDIEKLARSRDRRMVEKYPWVHCLYLEWYSKANGRVVIESTRYAIEPGEHAWTMSEEDEARQRAGDPGTAGPYPDEPEDDAPGEWQDDSPMDEFQWERFMKESDARADKFSALFEKYIDHPDRDRIIAREMGWDWLEEALDEQEEGGDGEPEALPDDVPELVPNPLTEGVDWVRNKHGGVDHPLVLRTRDLAMEMWHHARRLKQDGETGDPDLHEMVFKAQTTGAKLAGALNHLAYGHEPDRGFIVAALKRALNYLHQSVAAGEKVAAKNLVDPEEMARCQKGLFEIRENILALMQKYRSGV